MKIEKFEDIISWQKSQELAILIYGLFKNNRDFSFVDQIKRATVSISNNIAEVLWKFPGYYPDLLKL